MTKFKDVIFEENVAIHCPEEWMANELLEYADSKGYEWNIGESYNNTRWYVNKKSMCYLLGYGTHCSIDHVLNNKDLYTVMKYEDVVIKDETSLNYELVIKGRKARIGDKLWLKLSTGITNVIIDEILIYNVCHPRITLINDNREKTVFQLTNLEFIKSHLFWEKPTIYQLPDTDGNLSEVKVGQEVWVSNKTINRIWEAKIIGLDKNLGIFLRYINHEYKGHITTPNITGKESFLKVTTNKPHRDFSNCQHWEENLNAKYWGVDKKGESYFYEAKPTAILDYGYFVGWGSDKHAGYRQDLLNENGVVDDWEYSLVERPEGE